MCSSDLNKLGTMPVILSGSEELKRKYLTQVASASNAGGTVRLQPGSPAHVRYVLIWFTKLPPDNAGTYRASVYRITVQGHR